MSAIGRPSRFFAYLWLGLAFTWLISAFLASDTAQSNYYQIMMMLSLVLAHLEMKKGDGA